MFDRVLDTPLSILGNKKSLKYLVFDSWNPIAGTLFIVGWFKFSKFLKKRRGGSDVPIKRERLVK